MATATASPSRRMPATVEPDCRGRLAGGRPLMPAASSCPPLDLDCRCERWTCTPALDAGRFAAVRRRLVLDGFKWDPQVGDVCTLAPFALVLPASTWQQLAALAERLTAEALAAEAAAASSRPAGRLGLPRPLRRALADVAKTPTPAAARVVRFDFHPTADGWRISEANSDVPGGYTEASHFTRLMADHFSGLQPAGDPAARLAAALAQHGRQVGAPVGHGLPGGSADHGLPGSVPAGGRLHGLSGAPTPGGLEVGRCPPAHGVLRWPAGCAVSFTRASGWRPCPHRLAGVSARRAHPGLQSRGRPAHREQALPARVGPPLDAVANLRGRASPTQTRGNWLAAGPGLDPEDGLLQHGAAVRELAGPRVWGWAGLQARLWPGEWVAQRRFAAVPIPTPGRTDVPVSGGLYDGRSGGGGLRPACSAAGDRLRRSGRGGADRSGHGGG